MHVANGKLMIGDYIINGDYTLPDHLKELCGGTATIFMGDVRVSTNVLKEDGSRAVGTRLQGPAYDALFKKGQPYRGEADILGVPYFTAYDPIKDARGETIGVLYVGVRQVDYLASYNKLKYLVMGISLALICLAGFANRLIIFRLFVPLNRMRDVLLVARNEGDLSQRLDYLKQDEVGEMCISFNGFMEKLCEVIATIAQSAEKLNSSGSALCMASGMILTNSEEVASQTAAVAVASEEMAAPPTTWPRIAPWPRTAPIAPTIPP